MATAIKGLGYVLGLAYSRPEFGTRLALSYTSPIDLTFSGQEGRVLGAAGATPALSDTRFGVEMPATLSLDFQQGIATNTALFGRIQQSRWGGFEIRPNLYPAGALVTYGDDVMRYDLGVKHRLSAEWGISALYSQEPQTGGLSSNLAPVDGLRAFTLGAEYTRGNAAIGFALSEVRFDDTTTGLGTTPFRGSTETGQGLSRSVSAIAFKAARKIAIGIWQVFGIDLPKQGFGKGGRPYGNAL